ncbi:hypothetical protein HZ326_16309 [Fusarium oxysporum f. sp. albedinis]|nr:hypothetical protein HZ326_16309 [Fusarium oxysporum f. sp. albedinis]
MIALSVPSFRIARLHLLVCHKCHCTPDGPCASATLPCLPHQRAVIAAAGQASRFKSSTEFASKSKQQ